MDLADDPNAGYYHEDSDDGLRWGADDSDEGEDGYGEGPQADLEALLALDSRRAPGPEVLQRLRDDPFDHELSRPAGGGAPTSASTSAATPAAASRASSKAAKRVIAASEFTREFDSHLHSHVAGLRAQFHGASSGQAAGSRPAPPAPETYHADYYDSDDEEAASGMALNTDRTIPGASGARAQLSNEQLLYDPEADNDDEKWMLRRAQQAGSAVNQQEMVDPFDDPADLASARNTAMGMVAAPTSHAVLNCPGCMALLCLDCQQHELYETQFRAMFVMNCAVDLAQRLQVGLTKSAKKKGRRAPTLADDDDQTYYPVQCRECSTVVAMYDADEIYHFFNVLASKP